MRVSRSLKFFPTTWLCGRCFVVYGDVFIIFVYYLCMLGGGGGEREVERERERERSGTIRAKVVICAFIFQV